MALIKHICSGKLDYLLPHHWIGREPNKVDTLISVSGVSRLHATIEWRNSGWFILDNKSTNGLWVSGERISSSQYILLNSGQRFCLGNVTEAEFEVLDLSPPEPLIIQEDNPLKSISLNDYQLLPNDEEPERAFFTGKDGLMSARVSDPIESNVHPVRHNQLICIASTTWRVFLPEILAPTEELSGAASNKSEFQLEGHISPDEEKFKIILIKNDEIITRANNSHFGLLLHLARTRLEDQREGIPNQEQGWRDIDQIQKYLGLEESHINIQVYRIRKHLSKFIPKNLLHELIIERRAGQIRTGFEPENLKISGGAGSLKKMEHH